MSRNADCSSSRGAWTFACIQSSASLVVASLSMPNETALRSVPPSVSAYSIACYVALLIAETKTTT